MLLPKTVRSLKHLNPINLKYTEGDGKQLKDEQPSDYKTTLKENHDL